MSANYTANYKLCQWEPTDKVLRTDFNEDNAKLDAALAGLARRTTAVEDRASATAADAYTTQRPQVAVGAYEGDAVKTRTIALGFRPRAVLVLRDDLAMGADRTTYHSGFAVDGAVTAGITIVSNGFRVTYDQNPSAIWNDTNAPGHHYIYLAFR